MDAVREIKSLLDIADVVGEYFQLKPAGSGSFRANCPFHQEKTPSFYVNRPRQSWHCFGCDQGGDVISFVMRMEGMEFPDALAYLAEKTGITLPKFNAKTSSERKRLHEVNDLAARFFCSALNNLPQADVARAYVAKRGLDELTIDLWRIGYAPNSWDTLTKALKEKNVTEDELLRTGLVLKSNRGGVYDRFRHRLMFPICDIHGNVVGFTGRTLSDNKKEAKYLNTPETLIYKKSNILYGLDKAKGEIKRQSLAVICEGNTDVIGSHQFNVTNVVCSSGTALTREQLGLLKRFTTNLTIAFDADAAGNAATLRGLDLARTLDFSIRIIVLPPEAGKDPDDAVRKDPELWKKAITDALPVIEWLYRNAFSDADTSTPEGKKQVAVTLLPEFKCIQNAVERDAWITRLARDLHVSEDALRETMREMKAGASHSVAANALKDETTSAAKKTHRPREDDLLDRIHAILRIQPDLSSLADSILGEYYRSIPQNVEHLDYLAILADREFQDQSSKALRLELKSDCTALQNIMVSMRRANLEAEMRDAERTGNAAQIEKLLAQFDELTRSSPPT